MIYEKIYEIENLRGAWQRVRANRAAPGIDKVTCEDFEKELELNLETLAGQIQNQSYRPLPVTVFKDHRTKKEGRLIGIACIRDRVVQQAILRVIGPHFEKIFLPCSYAYRPGKSALSAVTKAGQLIKSGHLWILQMDVQTFFDAMDHSILLELIGKVIDEKPLIRLAARLIKAKIFKEMGLFDNVLGSHQGSGLSPLLSNIYLHPLDCMAWGKYKDRYLRYSDDIAFLGREKEEVEEAKQLIGQCLTELKLKPHPSKTVISHVGAGITYLGFYLDVAGKGPAMKSIEQLQTRLKEYDKVRKSDSIADKLNEMSTIIRGWHRYYQTLNPVKPQNILTLLALVRLAQELGQPQLARQLLKTSADFKHNHPEISFQLAELLSSLGMQSQAMREYARALQMDPDLEKVKDKVRTLQQGESDLHRAIEKIQLILHHNPHYREGYEKLAEYYTELGLYGFAEKAHQKVLELDDDPEHTPASPLESVASGSADGDGFDYQSVSLENFLQVFSGRTDAHAKQWVDERGRWGFLRVERGLKTKDVFKHLKGEETLAVYPVSAKDTVYFVVFDVDTARRALLEDREIDLDQLRGKAHEDILRIKQACAQMGLALYIEDSGYKGRHGWLFFSEEVSAGKAILLGRKIMEKAGEPSRGMLWELFPMGKSERHKSQIKLPLGINRKNNRRCLFLTDDNRPVSDQGLLLQTLKLNSPDLLQQLLREEKQSAETGTGHTSEVLGETGLSPGLARMVESCKVVSHLIAKARDTNYLSHYERLCLLYTLSFAGEEGCRYLHKVISCCINYDYHYTQREIERRKASPMSCPRIMETFPELAETLPCNCKFNLPPRSYPSPVLYLLEAVMEGAQPRPAPVDKPLAAEETDKQDEKTEQQDLGERILDFDGIFSSESSGEPPGESAALTSMISAEENDRGEEVFVAGMDQDGALTKAPEAANEIVRECRIPEEEGRDVDQRELRELALEYFRIRSERAKLSGDLRRIEERLERHFAGKDNGGD